MSDFIAREDTISRLNEFTMKNKLPLPIYTLSYGQTGFQMTVEVGNWKADGFGRSKKLAKQDSSSKLLTILKQEVGNKNTMFTQHDVKKGETAALASSIDGLQNKSTALNSVATNFQTNLAQSDLPSSSKKKSKNHKNKFTSQKELPKFEAVSEVGNKNTMFTQHDVKKGETAALASSIDGLQNKSTALNSVATNFQTNSDQSDLPSSSKEKSKNHKNKFTSQKKLPTFEAVSDRHNFFSKLPDEIKKKAFEVIGKDYEDLEQKVYDIIKALGFTYKLTEYDDNINGEQEYTFEIICDYNPFFMGTKAEIFDYMLCYLPDMLM